MSHVVEEKVCKRCRRLAPEINGMQITHLMPTGHICGGMSVEEATFLAEQMAAEAGMTQEEIPQAVASTGEPCSFCKKMLEQIYPDGKGHWFTGQGTARICGHCVILMAELVVGEVVDGTEPKLEGGNGVSQ